MQRRLRDWGEESRPLGANVSGDSTTSRAGPVSGAEANMTNPKQSKRMPRGVKKAECFPTAASLRPSELGPRLGRLSEACRLSFPLRHSLSQRETKGRKGERCAREMLALGTYGENAPVPRPALRLSCPLSVGLSRAQRSDTPSSQRSPSPPGLLKRGWLADSCLKPRLPLSD